MREAMMMGEEKNAAARFEARLRTLLPEMYKVSDENVKPVSMGSAGLKYGPDGSVLWNEMWGSFCDLAMAGGPPHRGTFLAPSASDGSAATVQVSRETCRGMSLVTGLFAEPTRTPGCVRMYCTSAAMSGWLARAIVMENVWAVSEGLALDLPTGSGFRVEKEIKNVITSVAKTTHYWQDHMSESKHDAIAELLRAMDREGPLLYPSATAGKPDEQSMAAAELQEETGLEIVWQGSPGWLGLECGSIAAAIWIMRALAVSNLLSRRENTVVFLPLGNLASGAGRTVRAVAEAHRMYVAAFDRGSLGR